MLHPEGVHFPNEILSIIINNLASDVKDNDRTSLAALASCRLASHLLHSLATPLLFSSIQLSECLAPCAKHKDKITAFMKRGTKLKQILTTSDIATSVHTLTLRCQKANLQNWKNGALLSAILRILPHIRTFTLASGGLAFYFTAIAWNFQLAIESLCRSPSLTALDLDNIARFPITVITGPGACPNLQRLRLSCVVFRFDHANPIDETSNLQPYKLDSLEIDDVSLDFLGLGDSDPDGDISFPKHLSRINNLRLRNLFRGDKILKCGWYIMLLASQSLTILDLRDEPKPDDELVYYDTVFSKASEIVPFDLGRFPALRHFKIQIRILPMDNVPMLRSLSQILSTSSSASGIETLEIMITWFDLKNGSETDLFSSDAGWSAIKEAYHLSLSPCRRLFWDCV